MKNLIRRAIACLSILSCVGVYGHDVVTMPEKNIDGREIEFPDSVQRTT